MQPTYLPWLGYLDLIDQVDHFVILDDVQFEKQSWQQRNQVRTPKGLEWITVPVYIKGRFGQLIKDVKIHTGKFPGSHVKQLRQNYNRAPHFSAMIERLEAKVCQAAESGHLCQLNLSLIDWLCDIFSIDTPRVLSSALVGVTGKRSDRLVKILNALGATEYVSPIGYFDYICKDMAVFQENGIHVKFANFVHPSYPQVYSPFMPFASAIDLAFNVGAEGLSVIRSGRKAATPMEAMER